MPSVFARKVFLNIDELRYVADRRRMGYNHYRLHGNWLPYQETDFFVRRCIRMLDLVPISQTGFNKLKEELSELEKKLTEVKKRVAEARQQGDLKENGAYIYGRQEQGFIEGRLGELRAQINRSEVVDCTKVQYDQAVFGAVVSLLDLNTQEKVTYQLLGPNDADYDTGSISIHSPVGEAILGLSAGDKASVTIPRGEFHFEVIDIARSQIE